MHRRRLFWIGWVLVAIVWMMLADAQRVAANKGPHGGYSATTDACAACHRTHTAGGSRLLISPSPAFCTTCHGSTGLGADTNVEDGVYLARDPQTENPDEGVAGRGLRGGGFLNAQMDTDEDGNTTSLAVTSAHDSNTDIMWGNGAIGSGAGTSGVTVDCVSCHDPHGNSNYRILRSIPLYSNAAGSVNVPDVAPTVYTIASSTGNYSGENYGAIATDLSQWCSQCHTRYHASMGSGHTYSGDNIFSYRHPTDMVSCVKCHVAHGTTATMTGAAGQNVLFPDGSSAASDNARSSLLRLDERKVCYSCHVNATTGAVSGGECQSCHNEVQGTRRQIVEAGGDFSLPNHHVDGIVQETDCTRCHELGAHTSGTVNLKDVDSGATISFSSNSALEPFCLACHDANGAAGQPPFSYNVASPVIDQTAWGSASHKVAANAPQTCYGSCHQNGHASGLDNLLNPWTGSPGTDNVNQEEGFCYTCHDADGPAASDIQTEFSQAYQHNISPANPGGEYMECTTCHNPHLASGAEKLADPDTGATTTWAGTQEEFCLTCHDGTAPTGISFPATVAGTGYNKSTFVNTTHDTSASGPDGLSDSCRGCHAQHGSSNLSNLLANYVIADYNIWNYGDGDYAVCWACHVEANIIADAAGTPANNRFGNLHGLHVNEEATPCILCHETHAPYDSGEAGLISFEFAIQNGYDISYIGGYNASTSFWIDGAQGYCYIRCHGTDHTPESYNR